MKRMTAIIGIIGMTSMLAVTAHASDDYQKAVKVQQTCETVRASGIGGATLGVKRTGASFKGMIAGTSVKEGSARYRIVEAIWNSGVTSDSEADMIAWAVCMDMLAP